MLKYATLFVACLAVSFGCSKPEVVAVGSPTTKSVDSSSVSPTVDNSVTPPGTTAAAVKPAMDPKAPSATNTTGKPAATDPKSGKPLAVANAGATPAASTKDAAYTLTIHPKVGSVLNYTMSQDMNFKGPKGMTKLGSKTTLKITCAKAQGGDYTLNTEVLDFKTTAPTPQSVIDQIKGKKSSAVIDSLGNPVAAGKGAAGAQAGASPLGGIVYPTKPLHVGDTWQSELAIAGSNAAKITCKLVSVSPAGPQQFATISLSGLSIPNTKVVRPMIMKVLLADGLPTDLSIELASTKDTSSNIKIRMARN